MVRLKRILVPTDFGEAAETALAYGRELARMFDASLDVLYVCEDVLKRGVGVEGYIAISPELQREVELAARQHLDDLLTAEDRERLQARTILVTAEAIPYAIIEHAKNANIDLIVMGTHGRGAMKHLLMGSVAERVVRMAPCPVLTVRNPERDFVVPDALVSTVRA